MIVSHKKFDLWEKTLIEKVSIRPPYRFSVNFSQQACFIYYEKGNTVIHSPGEQVPVSANESLLLNCGTYFGDLTEYSDADIYEILVFHLHPEILKRIYRQEFPQAMKNRDDHSYINKIPSREIIRKFIENLYFYFENPSLVNEELLELKVKELILVLLHTRNAPSIRDLFLDLFTPTELNLKKIIDSHLYSELSVKDLAGLANMTLATFNRKFHEIFQDTPASYIKAQRLERARELLKMTMLNISEVAFQTCFNDLAHFSRSFKERFNISPSSFRESLK